MICRSHHGARFGLVLLVLLLASSFLAGQDASEEEAAGYAREGQRALAAGDYPAAQSSFEKLEKIAPNVAEVHASLAAIYFKERQYEPAVREIRTAQRLKPSLPRLDSLLGLSLAEMGELAQAVPGLEKGFKQTADDEVRRMCGLELLRVYTGLHRDADAMATALELNRIYPDDPEVLYHTGRVAGNYAYTLMEKLRTDAPNSIWMLQAQGEANESEKNYDVAIRLFQQVLAMDPRRPAIHYRMGRVYMAKFQSSHAAADRESARHEFEQELEIDPGNGNAAYELAQMSADDNNLDAARKQFEAVLARYPNFEQALVGLGGVLLESNAARDAAVVLNRAVKIDPGDEVGWYRLARAEHAVGDQEAAQKAMSTFQTLHASQPTQRASVSADELTPQKLDAAASQ